ncbi:uncharacterized protein LOC103712882 [Phoenix dactylifera]|uniref:Uncharacterized protein LOC103712882 n=1 Tax=Phoenix dactylifera TaxID=42345 RepID=A0A8B7CEV4_PHODC|nr:uncharacterized protein LOC103712882 [Phoenix dactylifera]
MVISAETASRPPDPPSAAAAVPSRAEAQGNLLHNFSFPVLKTWGNQRLLRCMNVNRKGEIIGGGTGRRSAVEGGRPRIRAPAEGGEGDAGLEEVREKLLVHLREAADRMKLVVPLPTGGSPEKPEPEPEPDPEPEAEAEPSSSAAARPWNLRTRRAASRAWMGIERHLSVSPPRPPVVAERRTVRLRSEDLERRDRPKFSITLTREEIEEDIYAVTGSRARRRPKKRPRVVQKQLDALFPGSWLSEITADTYRVPE